MNRLSDEDLAGLDGQSDDAIWEHARVEGFPIVSKDNDFRQRSFLKGSPPKVVWLSVGNAGTGTSFLLTIRNIRNFCAPRRGASAYCVGVVLPQANFGCQLAFRAASQ